MKRHLLVLLAVCALAAIFKTHDPRVVKVDTKDAVKFTIGGIRLGDTREQVEALWGKDRYSHWPDLSPDIPAQEKPWFVEFDEDDRVCGLGGNRLKWNGTVILQMPFTEDEMREVFGKPELVERKPFGCRGGYKLFHYSRQTITLTPFALETPIQLRNQSHP